eukprot:366437-Chlamydomonas_euryale.AAC.5
MFRSVKPHRGLDMQAVKKTAKQQLVGHQVSQLQGCPAKACLQSSHSSLCTSPDQCQCQSQGCRERTLRA